MTKRSKLNLLAALVIAGGGIALGDVTPATAATVDGCANMKTALAEERDACFSSGGKRMTYSGSCSSSGYYLETNCYY